MKKFVVLLCIISVFCFSFALVCSCNVVFAEGEEEIVQETEVVSISSTDEFNTFAQNVNNGSVKNCIVELECDLDFSGKNFTQIGTEEHPFVGTFDGFGYYIKNLTLEEGGGVFNFAKNATIKNLGAKIEYYLNDIEEENPEQKTTNVGFIAYASNCKIEGCKVEAEVRFSSQEEVQSATSNKNINFGTVVALSEGCEISNSFALIDLDFIYSGNDLTEGYFGGIVGRAISGVVRNCFASPVASVFAEERANINLRKTTLSSKLYFGGICGYVQGRNFKLFNTAFFGNQELSNITSGGIVGKITNSSTNIPSTSNIYSSKFFISSNTNAQAIGQAPTSFVNNSTLTVISGYPQDKSFFEGDFWDEMYAFDFNSIWKDNNVYSGNVFFLPDLQQFVELTISLDTSSIYTLKFKNEDVSVKSKQFKIGDNVKIEASFNIDTEKEIDYANYYSFQYWDNGITRTPFAENNTLEIVVSNETAGNYKAVTVGKDIEVTVTVRNEEGVIGNFGKISYGTQSAEKISFVAKYADSSKVYKLQAVENILEYKFECYSSGDVKIAGKTFSFKFDNINSNKLPITILDGKLVCDISAVFTNNTSVLNVNVDKGGNILFENDTHRENFSETIVNEKEYTLSATATEGYVFEGWFIDGELYSDKNDITITINKETNITAKYSNVNTSQADNTMLWIIIGSSVGGGVLLAGIILIIIFSVKKKNKFNYKKNYRY